MLDWLKSRVSTTDHQRESDADAASRDRGATSGTYLSLYEYLEKRYANRVVLTFAEIEDLLGFTLPDLARLRREWWTDPDPDTTRPGYSQSWTRAGRTAAPNLLARTVVFDRAS